ncbi:LacI family transcriptional regulator [Limnohabitans sp. 2KL-1]|uniref:LacI family DNA-binding transcriptional regulator n=1 Tax=Limnohabitans sp. 2KL-1 TaxID=1100699 RepID=UPI000DD19211|nr:LacI family DNA-binding transcriptional regulator [Limnohabitans sp. 2KL-1]PUE45681.1 LacI family transcriptional regulator [Limnohabitans sp. 2KL-1]
MAKAEPDKRKIQMADIARLAGVSTATVSRALNGSPLINEETRLRIIELARSLNYTINLGAQNLRKGDSSTIGVVIPFNAANKQNITDPFFLAILGSLADALTDKQYDLLLSRVDADHLDRISALYDSGRVGGIVVVGQWGHHDQLNELARQRLPFVAWGAQLPGQLYCSVGSDNTSGGILATEHLLSLGRKRVAFMGDKSLPEPEKRHAGYLKALRKAGLKADPALCISTSFAPLDAQEAMRQHLDRHGLNFDALVAASDLIAIGAMGVLKDRGYRVPEEVSVVGYDDVEPAAHSFPPLTTVRQPMHMAGVQLVDSLLRVMAGEKPESATLPTTLVLRESTQAV